MRAHWLSDLTLQDSYVLKDESLHHLVNVIRIEVGEELLLLNGQGLQVLTEVENIAKRELRLKFKAHIPAERKYIFDLALGMPKREAFELCLKQATELGFRKIYLIRSAYSQMKAPEMDRMEKLLVSALEQSNASFMPEIEEVKWEEVPWSHYHSALLLDSQTSIKKPNFDSAPTSPHLLIVGPEGGFSPEELKYLHSQNQVKVVNLPTPILRTPTALAAGTGIMLESLLK